MRHDQEPEAELTAASNRNQAAAWREKRILFVSGKGGVGKSLVAAAVAQELHLAGRRVLLAEIGDTSYYKDFWKLSSIGHVPVPSPMGFDVALWDGESCLREYVMYYLRMQRLYRLFFENKIMRAFIDVAPGLNEIAILGKITSGVRKIGPPLAYDTVVVDCYATGHARALLQAPAGLARAIHIGPMGAQSREIDAVLRDPAVCTFLTVTLLEEMPVAETLEFHDSLRRDLGIEAEIIANKVLPLPASLEDLRRLEATDTGIGEFARFLYETRERQDGFLTTLRKSVPKLAEIPLIFSAEPNALVRAAGEALREA